MVEWAEKGLINLLTFIIQGKKHNPEKFFTKQEKI